MLQTLNEAEFIVRIRECSTPRDLSPRNNHINKWKTIKKYKENQIMWFESQKDWAKEDESE